MTIESVETAFASANARSNLALGDQGARQTPHYSIGAKSTATSNIDLQLWGGSFHRVAGGVTFPAGRIQVIWQHCCAGNPPLRLLGKHDMATRVKKFDWPTPDACWRGPVIARRHSVSLCLHQRRWSDVHADKTPSSLLNLLYQRKRAKVRVFVLEDIT
ncbi:hypothetical protein L914_19587 [Phytophthora nicotianae]|uniref:Uncharacterized protein n=1 Tax=Phytophthora nicotianae TaxID=4792 RepID=W2M9Z6_PHYNI|nr:hypothetical protein L914_19587 [Phytophthora nicotianae]